MQAPDAKRVEKKQNPLPPSFLNKQHTRTKSQEPICSGTENREMKNTNLI
jgi:hypothetical protein